MKETIPARHIRGAYSYIDVNRVICAMEHIAEWMAEWGYDWTGYVLDSRKPYGPEDAMRFMDAELYLQNVEALRRALTVSEGTPETPKTMQDALTIQGSNDIEAILVAVDSLRPLLKLSPFPCGMINCGGI